MGYDRHGQAVMWLGQAVVPWTCLKPTSKSRVRLSNTFRALTNHWLPAILSASDTTFECMLAVGVQSVAQIIIYPDIE